MRLEASKIIFERIYMIICLDTYRNDRQIKKLIDETVKSNHWYSEVREKITDRFGNDLPEHFKDVMAEKQIKPYMFGDAHNVEYKKEMDNFNDPIPVPCEVTMESCQKTECLDEDCNSISCGELVLGNDCINGIDEAFQWIDLTYKVTLNFLKSLPDDTKLFIYTRSDLVAHDLYLEQLKRLNVDVTILYTSKDEELNRRRESGAPSFKRRKIAYKKLKDAGIDVYMFKHKIARKKRKAA